MCFSKQLMDSWSEMPRIPRNAILEDGPLISDIETKASYLIKSISYIAMKMFNI